jgi:hypothetical protein
VTIVIDRHARGRVRRRLEADTRPTVATINISDPQG